MFLLLPQKKYHNTGIVPALVFTGSVCSLFPYLLEVFSTLLYEHVSVLGLVVESLVRFSPSFSPYAYLSLLLPPLLFCWLISFLCVTGSDRLKVIYQIAWYVDLGGVGQPAQS